MVQRTQGYPDYDKVAHWSCSQGLNDSEIKASKPDDKTRRGEAEDAHRCCRHINPISAEECQRCGKDFDVGSEALDKDENVIATMKIYLKEKGIAYFQDAKDPTTQYPTISSSLNDQGNATLKNNHSPNNYLGTNKMVEVTSVIQSDHTQWRCKKCKRRNPMTATRCTKCGRSRRIGAKALNVDNTVIGELMIVNTVGDEFWEYYDLITVIVEE
ncbi:hypothetical protein ACHAPT_002789 [Fusarium lateritium]